MKLSFCLCFLVLVISSVSRGQTPTVPPGTEEPSPVEHEQNKSTVSDESGDYITTQTGAPHPTTTQQTLNESENEATNLTQPKPKLLVPASSTSPEVTRTEEDKTPTSGLHTEVATVATMAEPVPGASSKAGYVVLVLIIIAIIILCVILYMLRRASRTYSFNLHSPGPSRHQDEPIGTFGQVYVDDLNQPAPEDIEMTDLTSTPVANGTSPEAVDKASSEENEAPEVQPETKDVQNSSSVSSSSDDEQAEKTSNKLSGSNLFFDTPEEQQNENNNNNPSVGSSCLFVEINLDEPAWSEQHLTSPPPSSSVFPFSSSS